MMRYVCLLAVCLHAQTIATQAEYELYSAVAKDFGAANYKQALVDLDAWSGKYPQTNVDAARKFLYAQAYQGAGQPEKALDAAKPLLALADPLPGNPLDHLRLLYVTVTSFAQIPKPSESQITLAEDAAKKLLAWETAPAGVAADKWPAMRKDFKTTSETALRYATITRVGAAVTSNDCPAADRLARAALEKYPESGQVSWYLGIASQCLYKTTPSSATATLMLHSFARAASLDPTKAGFNAQWQKSTAEPHLKRLYEGYHGSLEGLEELKAESLTGPLPGAEFAVLSHVEIDEAKRRKFEKDHPEMALWNRIKQALATQGQAYYDSDLKESKLPALKGRLVDAKPMCKPKVLWVAISDDASGPEVEIHLEKPLNGKPSGEIRWEGVPSAYAANPLLLTMDAETVTVDTTPCGK